MYKRVFSSEAKGQLNPKTDEYLLSAWFVGLQFKTDSKILSIIYVCLH